MNNEIYQFDNEWNRSNFAVSNYYELGLFRYMKFGNFTDLNRNGVFHLSQKLIWFSSLLIGVLASIPNILQWSHNFVKLNVDVSIAFLFSLVLWYYNLYLLPKYSKLNDNGKSFRKRLLLSFFFGVGIMMSLVIAHHFLFPQFKFSSMMMMYQFRGIFINLTIFMFLNFLYQNFNTQQVLFKYHRIKADNLNAQFELLKQQVNPHFLFNSLNTLQAMIDDNDSETSEFVQNLSLFYRYSLVSKKNNLIQIQEEITILESFVFLVKSRFEEGVNISISIDCQTKLTYIPPFTLQLLVENCIKHNVVSFEKPLLIQIYEEKGFIIVKNNRQLKNNKSKSIGIGLANISGRYYFSVSKEIEIIANENEFCIKLPLIYECFNN